MIEVGIVEVRNTNKYTRPDKPCGLPDLGEVAEVHDVWTAGEVEGYVDGLVAGGPGRLQHHLHLHVVGVPLSPGHLGTGQGVRGLNQQRTRQ